MPQIIVEYDLDGLDIEQLQTLDDRLCRICATILSVDEWPISTADFGFKPEKLEAPARGTHNVVVRLLLHNFEVRVGLASEHKVRIMNAVRTVLASYGHPATTTVGVSLGYLNVEWIDGQIGDYGEL